MSNILGFKKNEKGQTLVEFALILPILLLLVMGIIQFGIIFSAQIGITNAAREGARAAAVGYSDDEVRDRVMEAIGSHISLTVLREEIDISERVNLGDNVMVTVPGKLKTVVPIPDLFVPGGNINLKSESSMRLETLP